MVKYLNWDSDFFGFNVASISEVKESEIVHYIQQSFTKNRLTYVFTKQKISESALHQFNGNLVDIKLVSEKLIENDNSILSHKNLTEFDATFSKENLYQLAYSSGKYSRFKLDTHIPLHKFQELYRLWVENSVAGSFASKVYIYHQNKSILGFITVQILDDIAKIGLIAVDTKSQGLGIGSKLVLKAEHYAIAENIKKIQVPTQQRNEMAVKFYKKNNFSCIEKTYVYHFWNNQLA